MPLKELEKDIQSRESKATKREHNKTVYNEWQSKEVEHNPGMWERVIDRWKSARTNAIAIGGVIIFTIILIFVILFMVFYIKQGFFNQERVSLNIEMATSVESNDLSEIEIIYENNNRADLNNVEVIVHFGEYFVPVDNQEGFKKVSERQGVITIGKIKGNEKGYYALAGFFVGPSGSVDAMGITMRYIPERTSTRYEKTARTTTNITSSPVVIDIQSPQEIVSGNLMNIVVSIQNTSNESLRDLNLKFVTPKSFSFYNSEPRANFGSTWLINEIAPQSEVNIVVRGSLKASIGSVQRFDAELGAEIADGSSISYAKNFYAPRIIRSPITVQQSVESSDNYVTHAGDYMNYVVYFKNDSSVTIRDAIITVNLEGNAVDYSKLDLNKAGDYDQEKNRIIWKASDVPALKNLKPQESGRVEFLVPVLEKLPVTSAKDHHFSITSIASIDSNDIPNELRENKAVLSNALSVPVSAKVLFDSSIQHKSGSFPLEVGEKSMFSVAMNISSVNNDLLDAEVHIPLPTHTTFEGSSDSSIVFSERTNEVVWKIGKIEHGSGIITDPVTAKFDVSVLPSVDQTDRDLLIIKNQELRAVDDFVDRKFSKLSDFLSSGDVASDKKGN